MNDNRYNRQTILSDFGRTAQKKLKESKVLVVGAGGLGVPVLTYLNAMGVGTLGIVDGDMVSLSNLHRQVLYDESDVGQLKAEVAMEKLKAQNSETRLETHNIFLTAENGLEIIKNYDVVVDASDNFPTRYLVNDICVILKKPFVYGALHGFEGQVSVFNHQNGPTYRCLYPNMPKEDEVPNCNEHGVLGVVPGIIGNLQALETVKVIAGIGEVLSGKLLLFNGLSNSFQKINFSPLLDNQNINSLQENYDFDCGIKINSIDTKSFMSLMEKRSIQLIDVRTAKEYKTSNLDIAKNVPLSQLESNLEKIDFTKDIYIICQSGIRSKKAIEKLQNFKPNGKLINVSGGMNHIKLYANTY